MIRRLSKVASDGPGQRRQVEMLVILCAGNWRDAQEIWEKTVEKMLDTVEVQNDMRRAELAAMTLLTGVVLIINSLTGVWEDPTS